MSTKESLATVMMRFVQDCRQDKSKIEYPLARQLVLNVLHAKDIDPPSRVEISKALLREWKPDATDESLNALISEFLAYIKEKQESLVYVDSDKYEEE